MLFRSKVNDFFCSVVNKTKTQVEGEKHAYIWDLSPEEAEAGSYMCMESDNQAIENGKTSLFDEVVKTKDGLRQFKTYKTPIYGASKDTVLGTVGFARDITDFKNLGLELELFLKNVPVGILLCDANCNVTNVNKQFTDMFEISKIAY